MDDQADTERGLLYIPPVDLLSLKKQQIVPEHLIEDATPSRFSPESDRNIPLREKFEDNGQV